MPRYQITGPDGRVVTVEGDSFPSEGDADAIFASLPSRGAPKAYAAVGGLTAAEHREMDELEYEKLLAEKNAATGGGMPTDYDPGEIRAGSAEKTYTPASSTGTNAMISGAPDLSGMVDSIRRSRVGEALFGRAPGDSRVIDKSSLGDRVIQMAADTGLEAGGSTAGQIAGAAGGPLAWGTVPIGGAIGGGIGNAIAQARRIHSGEQDGFKFGQLGASAATGAIPGSGILKGGKTLLRAAEGAGISSAANAGASLIDTGHLPSAKEAAIAAALGGAGGVAASKLHGKAPVAAAEDIAPEMQEAILARQRLKESQGVDIPSSMAESYPSAAPLEEMASKGLGGGALQDVAARRDAALNRIQQDMAGRAKTPTEVGAPFRETLDRTAQAHAEVDAASNISPELQASLKNQIAERTSGVKAGDPSIGSTSLIGVADDVGQKLEGFVTKAKQQAAEEFGAFNKSLADAGLDGNFVKLGESSKVAQRILDKMPQVDGEIAPGFSQGLEKLRGIAAIGSQGQSIEQAQAAKAIIGQAIGNPSSELGQGIDKGALKQLYKSISADIDTAVEKAPGARDLLKKAVNGYKANVEQFELYGIDRANVAAGDKQKGVVGAILGELQNGGESQVYNNIERVLGHDGTQSLNKALKQEIEHSSIDTVKKVYDLPKYLSEVQAIRRRSPDLADKLGLPTKDQLMTAQMAHEAIAGTGEIPLSTVVEGMKVPEVAAILKSGDLTKAIQVLKTAQAKKDAISRDILSTTLAGAGFNMKSLPPPDSIYQTLIRDKSVPASKVSEYIDAFERKAASGAPDAQEAANLLAEVRKTEAANLFSMVSEKPSFNPGASAKMAAQDAGIASQTINPQKLRSVILSPASEAEKNVNQKLQAVMGSKFQTFRDLALALGPTQRAQESAGNGSAASTLVQWLGNNPLSRAFLSRLLSSDRYPAYLTGAGQARRFFQSGQATATLTRQAFTQGAVENKALIGALEDNGMIDDRGKVTRDGEAAVDRFRR